MKLISTPINRMAWLAVGAASWLLAGCAANTCTKPDVSSTAPPPPAIPSGISPVTNTMMAEASAEEVGHFNFAVKVTGNGPAEAVRQAVEGKLAAAGCRLNADAADILVSLAVHSSEFDRSGNYLRYEGTVEVGVSRAWDGKRLGFDTVSLRGQRGLGEAAAMRNLTGDLVAGVSALVMKFAQPEQPGPAVTDVTVKRPWLVDRDPETRQINDRNPEYSRRFINTVKKLPGVIYCAQVAHDCEARALTYRMVYLADAMPGGVINRLATLDEIKIKPRN